MKNSLEIMFPEVAKQWSTRNFPLLPKDVSYGSNKKVWWRVRTRMAGKSS